MGKHAVGPPKNRLEQIAVRLIVDRGKSGVAARVAMYFQYSKVAPGCLLKKWKEALRGPCHAVRRAHHALVIGDRHNGVDREAVVHIASAPATECHSHRLKAITGEQVELERRVVLLGEP
jgi:hypothetical protein